MVEHSGKRGMWGEVGAEQGEPRVDVFAPNAESGDGGRDQDGDEHGRDGDDRRQEQHGQRDANGRSAAWRPGGAVLAMEAPRIPLALRSVG